MIKIYGAVFIFVICLLVVGCISSRRQHDFARLYRVVPGEERYDFARLVSWIAERDGQITLPEGKKIHWEETSYYRWYSNETFVILTCPPRFNEGRSFVRWLYGSVEPVRRSVGWALAGEYGLRGPATYDFPGVRMRPEIGKKDGIFGALFDDGRERLLRLQEWHISDQSLNNQKVAILVNKNPEYDSFNFNWLRGYPNIHMHLHYTQDKRVGLISIRMPESPSLAGLDFMKEDPPVLRQGSFIVDAELADKGKRRSENAAPRPHQPERRKP